MIDDVPTGAMDASVIADRHVTGATPGERHLLLIAYDFPPIGGSGVQRMLKFVKHLPVHGWQITVLTVRTSQTINPVQDDTLLAEVPDGVKVIRSGLLDPYDNVAFRAIAGLGHWLGTLTGKRSCHASSPIAEAGEVTRRAVTGSTAPFRSASTHSNGGMLQRVLNAVHALMVPDRYIGWYPYARRVGEKTIIGRRVDVILSTSPCETAHLVGLSLSRRYGIPLVVDFRDPWTGYYFAIDRLAPARWLNRRLERAVLSCATRVISTEPGCSDSLKALVPEQASAKFQVITNGYDEADFQGIEPLQFDRFTLIFTGTVYQQVTPSNVFEALRRISAEQSDLHDRLQFVFVGNTFAGFDSLVERHGLQRIVRTLGYRPHHDSIAHLTGADLCYYNVFSNLAITGKLFEYLRSGTEILATIPADHSAAAMITEAGAGCVIEYDDIDAIVAAITSRLDAYSSIPMRNPEESTPGTAPNIVPEAVRRFERQALSARLSAYLHEAAIQAPGD